MAICRDLVVTAWGCRCSESSESRSDYADCALTTLDGFGYRFIGKLTKYYSMDLFMLGRGELRSHRCCDVAVCRREVIRFSKPGRGPSMSESLAKPHWLWLEPY